MQQLPEKSADTSSSELYYTDFKRSLLDIEGFLREKVWPLRVSDIGLHNPKSAWINVV